MSKLLRFFRRARRERELDAELQAHLDALIAEKQQAGLSPAEAMRAAGIEFGAF